jgi:hypothetical protein
LSLFCSILVITFSYQNFIFARSPLPENGHILLTGLSSLAPDYGTSRVGEAAKTTWDRGRDIRFSAFPKFEKVKGTESLPYQILNPTIPSKARLTLDKPIYFKGSVVSAGTNLLTLQQFDGGEDNVRMDDLNPHTYAFIKIKKDFVFPPSEYQIKFEWFTKRGEVFAETLKVYIDTDLSKKYSK